MTITATALAPDFRVEALRRLADEQFDVLVIGAGVVGAGAALDAASRGLSVALVEARDFASGTSSRSSKLVHGGLRYLKQLNFHLVFEALRERKLILERLCPHLARPVEFIYPLEKPVWDRAYVGAGVGVYDVLGAGRGVPHHLRHLSKQATLRSFRSGKPGAIKGGIAFYEGQLDDARHTMMIARTAADYGVAVASSMRVTAFVRDGAAVTGAVARDLESGTEFTHPGDGDDQRRRGLDRRDPGDDRRQGPVPGAGEQGRAHRRAARPHRLRHRSDHRDREEPPLHHPVPVERRVLGHRDDGHPVEPRPRAPRGEQRRTSTTSSSTRTRCWRGRSPATTSSASTRACVRCSPASPTAPASSPASTPACSPVPGLVVVAGGKYTTYRVMAKDARGPGRQRARPGRARCVTDEVPLVGASRLRGAGRHEGEPGRPVRPGRRVDRAPARSLRLGDPGGPRPRRRTPRAGRAAGARPPLPRGRGATTGRRTRARCTSTTCWPAGCGCRSTPGTAASTWPREVAEIVAPVLGWDAATIERRDRALRASGSRPSATRRTSSTTRPPTPPGSGRRRSARAG